MFLFHLDQILLNLHSLPYLSYLNIYSVLIQLPHQVTTIFKIKSLQRLILHSFDPILLHFNKNNISPLTQLEYLSIDACYVTDLLELLKYVGPSLKKMNISLRYQHQENPPLIDPLIINQFLSNNNMPSKQNEFLI